MELVRREKNRDQEPPEAEEEGERIESEKASCVAEEEGEGAGLKQIVERLIQAQRNL